MTKYKKIQVLGSGADGLVRRMTYRGRTYAVKSIYPLYDKETSSQPKVIYNSSWIITFFDAQPSSMILTRANEQESEKSEKEVQLEQRENH